MSTTKEDPVLTAYVRHVIIGVDNDKPTPIAVEFGIAPATVVNIRDGTRGVGFTTAQKIARARFNDSLDRLKAAATEWAKENPPAATATVSLPVDGHGQILGSRDAASQTHVRYGEHTEADIRQAAARVAESLEAGEDPGERWWYEQIDAELKRRRKPGLRPGERVVEADGELIVTDDEASPADVEAAKRAFPRTIPDRSQSSRPSNQPPGAHKKAGTAKPA